MKRTATLVALGLFAASVPFLIGYGADAEDADPRPESGWTGTLDIGTTELLDLDLSQVTRTERVLSYPGAEYVKVHFARTLLLPGDYLTVSNPDGTESHRYDGDLESHWATSITGDTAVVTLHTTKGVAGSAVGAVGAQIDKVARGFTPEEKKAREDDARRPESLCGGDDAEDAACYRETEPEIYDNADPVARLLINGTTLCTAFRVGENNRMLTNNHCFDSTAEARATEVWFDYRCETCGGDDVGRPVKVRGERVHATNQTYDFTLFSVDDFAAIEKFGHLTLANRPATRGEKLYIPQNPGGAPTQIAMNSDMDGGSCRVDDPAFDGYATDSDVSYYCDTEFGSSGSPVLSRETHEVVALHHFGGCPNSGVRSDKLLSLLNGLL